MSSAVSSSAAALLSFSMAGLLTVAACGDSGGSEPADTAAAPDTSEADGAADATTTPPDTDGPDVEPSDVEPSDVEPSDTEPSDTEPSDTQAPDTEVPPDSGVVDAATGDTAAADADAAVPCAGVDCSHLDGACTVGLCDPDTGACGAQPKDNGVACDDGSGCTVDACVDGACVGTPDCTAQDGMCTVGICDMVTDTCQATPVLDGTPCDDGDSCTVDACQAGACVGTEDTLLLAAAGSDVVVEGSTADADDRFASACGGADAPDQTYRFTVASRMALRFSTDHPTTSFDALLHVHGSDCDAEALACVDNIAPSDPIAEITRMFTPGDYRVTVDGASESAAGTFGLVVSSLLPYTGAHFATFAGSQITNANVSDIVYSNCPVGQVLIGLNLWRAKSQIPGDESFPTYYYPALVRWQGVCGEYVLTPSGNGYESTVTETGPLTARGSYPTNLLDAPQSIRCPDDTVVVGYSGYTATALYGTSNLDHFRTITLRCAPLAMSGHEGTDVTFTVGAVVNAGTVGPANGQVSGYGGPTAIPAYTCPAGSVVNLMVTKHGDIVEGFGVRCGYPTPTTD